MRLIQISDCHLCANPEARSRIGYPLSQLRAVVARARRLRPDIVLVSGDIGHDESPAAYRHAFEVFAEFECPWFWMTGNHDHPEFMEELHPFHDELDLGDWRLLLLDSRVPGQAGGELGQDALQELAVRLEEDDRPTLLAMHHPPLSVGSAWMDALGLADREAFWQTLAAYAQVRAVLCGHIHQAFAARHGDIAVYGCPATADQFLPRQDDFTLDEASRPGFRIVDLEGQRLSTWVERVDP
ncbi:metallophosphoesterase [Chromohalobacter sp. HP20-39]|uniref:metallophosphoesterase n=1 Tax=Chromohalobacter sp. HP20-39 TaxID=3079306 RepID=UPI00294AB8FD|nr:metallophosphoesterase [Chromohalobacter sp. HP20-39]MDV6317514.1 metallophosphoesterase [Chromohalobacter sp. HP20-39]